MDVLLPKFGKYVMAVSGGVDSVALLHMLQQQDGLELVVAHFDHGMRADAVKDRLFVQELAKNLGLPFVYEEGNLGEGSSEAKAREARYKFLRQVLREKRATVIITAHHQDDVLETAIINMLRGTGRKGLTALKNQPDILRPLLKVSKNELITYAKKHRLQWREDSTNQNTNYLRNYVRHRILPRLEASGRADLVNMLTKMEVTNRELDAILADELGMQTGAQRLNREWFNQLPHSVAREVLAAWLRANGDRGFDSQTLERLVVAAKVARPGKVFPVQKQLVLQVRKSDLALKQVER
jgi:tRNA(Ile)-lysidine synthase